MHVARSRCFARSCCFAAARLALARPGPACACNASAHIRTTLASVHTPIWQATRLQVRGVAAGGVRAKVAVIQFSNDVRVEQGPADVDVEAFEALMTGMVRSFNMLGWCRLAWSARLARSCAAPHEWRHSIAIATSTDAPARNRTPHIHWFGRPTHPVAQHRMNGGTNMCHVLCNGTASPLLMETISRSHLLPAQHRMNGGTNIALAVQKAGQLLKPLGPRTQRVLVLLTDGRIDSHQVSSAAEPPARHATHGWLGWLAVCAACGGLHQARLSMLLAATCECSSTLHPICAVQSREAHDMCARLADEQASAAG